MPLTLNELDQLASPATNPSESTADTPSSTTDRRPGRRSDPREPLGSFRPVVRGRLLRLGCRVLGCLGGLLRGRRRLEAASCRPARELGGLPQRGAGDAQRHAGESMRPGDRRESGSSILAGVVGGQLVVGWFSREVRENVAGGREKSRRRQPRAYVSAYLEITSIRCIYRACWWEKLLHFQLHAS